MHPAVTTPRDPLIAEGPGRTAAEPTIAFAAKRSPDAGSADASCPNPIAPRCATRAVIPACSARRAGHVCLDAGDGTELVDWA